MSRILWRNCTSRSDRKGEMVFLYLLRWKDYLCAGIYQWIGLYKQLGINGLGYISNSVSMD